MPKSLLGTTVTMMLAVGVAGCASSQQQTASGYRFEAIDTQVRPSRDAEVRVRLVHLPDSRPILGAVIYDRRFRMTISGYKIATSHMVEGANPPPVLAADKGNGIYRLHSELPMQRDW